MQPEEIKQDHHIQEFLMNRNIRETTQYQYIKRIQMFCDFTKKTPTELIEEAENDEDNKIRMKKRNIKRHLMDFIFYLKENNKSENYISDTMSTVKSFYREFDIELPNIRVKSANNNSLITTDDIVQREHILKALDHCNLKYKAIILLMSSSGMGLSEISNLSYKDFLNAISEHFKPADNELYDVYLLKQKLEENKNDAIGTWQIQRYKTGKEYVTFSSPESIQMIVYYLIDRILQNRPIKSVDNWLFESNGTKLMPNTMVVYFMGLNDRCEFGYTKNGKHRFFISHKLRKYFASTLHKNKIPELTTHWFLGHRVDTVTEAYFKADINALKEQYKMVVEDLSIENVIVREITTDGYDKLIDELNKERLVRKMESEEKDEELARMSRRIELMEKLLSDKEFVKDKIK